MAQARAKKAFSIIEVLVSACLVVLTLSFCVLLVNRALSLIAYVNRTTAAIFVVCSEMESLRVMPFSDVLLLNGGQFGDGKGLIKVALVWPDLASVSISYKFSENKPPMSISTLRSR